MTMVVMIVTNFWWSVRHTTDSTVNWDDNCDGIVDEGLSDTSVLSWRFNHHRGDADPSSVNDADGEWFEIYNDSGIGLNLDGLGFRDEGSDDFSVSGDLYLLPEEYMVFGTNGNLGTNGGVVVAYEYASGMTLGNSSDEIEIYTSSDIIDTIAWDNGATFPDPNGLSMSLIPEVSAADNDNGYLWCEATTAYGDGDQGTPGAKVIVPMLFWTDNIGHLTIK